MTDRTALKIFLTVMLAALITALMPTKKPHNPKETDYRGSSPHNTR